MQTDGDESGRPAWTALDVAHRVRNRLGSAFFLSLLEAATEIDRFAATAVERERERCADIAKKYRTEAALAAERAPFDITADDVGRYVRRKSTHEVGRVSRDTDNGWLYPGFIYYEWKAIRNDLEYVTVLDAAALRAAEAEARRAALIEMTAECDRVKTLFPGYDKHGTYDPGDAKNVWETACDRNRAHVCALAASSPAAATPWREIAEPPPQEGEIMYDIRVGLEAIAAQVRKTWLETDYPEDMQSDRAQFRHAHLHAMKALGKIAALIDHQDHALLRLSDEARGLRNDLPKLLADLIRCTAKMAETAPTVPVPLARAYTERATQLAERWGHGAEPPREGG